jgi:hypothetical protein
VFPRRLGGVVRETMGPIRKQATRGRAFSLETCAGATYPNDGEGQRRFKANQRESADSEIAARLLELTYACRRSCCIAGAIA